LIAYQAKTKPLRNRSAAMAEIIIPILKSLGIYEKARKKFNSDEQLAECFDQDFDGLLSKFM